MSIRDWPEAERPREKLINRGPATLSYAELLAIFIRSGTRNHTSVDIGRQLLSQFDGLRGLMNASQEQLCQQPCLGMVKYAQLQAILELSRRHPSLPDGTPTRLPTRSIRLTVPGQQTPGNCLRGTVPWHHQQHLGTSPRGGQT